MNNNFGTIDTPKKYRLWVHDEVVLDTDSLEDCACELLQRGFPNELEYMKRVNGGHITYLGMSRPNHWRIEKTRYATDYQMF